MPLTAKGQAILDNLVKEYGPDKGKAVLYAGQNKGTFTGIDSAKTDADKAVVYKGYRIYPSLTSMEWFVSKGGAHIVTVKSVEAGKKEVDYLTRSDSAPGIDSVLAACDSFLACADAFCTRMESKADAYGNSRAYEAALATFRTASSAFREAQTKYRARKIGDAEFLKAKAAFDQAEKNMDRAAEKELAAKP